jgi:tRNA(Ile2) C34 agmatinyltransferase TiaS
MSRRPLHTALDVTQRVIEASHRGTISVTRFHVTGEHDISLAQVDDRTHAWLSRLVAGEPRSHQPRYANQLTRIRRHYGRHSQWDRFDVITFDGYVGPVLVEWTRVVPHAHRQGTSFVSGGRVMWRCTDCRQTLTHTEAKALNLPTRVAP